MRKRRKRGWKKWKSKPIKESD